MLRNLLTPPCSPPSSPNSLIKALPIAIISNWSTPRRPWPFKMKLEDAHFSSIHCPQMHLFRHTAPRWRWNRWSWREPWSFTRCSTSLPSSSPSWCPSPCSSTSCQSPSVCSLFRFATLLIICSRLDQKRATPISITNIVNRKRMQKESPRSPMVLLVAASLLDSFPLLSPLEHSDSLSFRSLSFSTFDNHFQFHIRYYMKYWMEKWYVERSQLPCTSGFLPLSSPLDSFSSKSSIFTFILNFWHSTFNIHNWGVRKLSSLENEQITFTFTFFVQLLMITFTFNYNFHFQWLQLRKLEMHLNNPQISSDEYRAEARVTFWKMVTFKFILTFSWRSLKLLIVIHYHHIFYDNHDHHNEHHYQQIWVHCSIGGLVLVIAFILTAGYAITCRNMWDIIIIIIINIKLQSSIIINLLLIWPQIRIQVL